MHGIIFSELQKFCDAALGPQAWPELCKDANVARPRYLATETYSDQELLALVGAAVNRTGVPAAQLLEQFGTFIVPDLLKVFGAFVKKEWKALDMLEHTEAVIHKAVRLSDSKATPPQLQITRHGKEEVRIKYSSPRRLCAVAKGIIRGVSTHYGEPLTLTETTCMHNGAAACMLVVTVPRSTPRRAGGA